MEIFMDWQNQPNEPITIKEYAYLLYRFYGNTVNRLRPKKVISNAGAYYEYMPVYMSLKPNCSKKFKGNPTMEEAWAAEKLFLLPYIDNIAAEEWSWNSNNLVRKKVFVDTIMKPVSEYIECTNDIVSAVRVGLLDNISTKYINDWYDGEDVYIRANDAYKIVENAKKILRKYQEENK